MAPHSSTLAWKIPWTEEPGGLQSMESLGVGHDWVTSLSLFTFMHWRRKWQPTPVFLPGESQGWGSLVGCVYGVAQSQTRLKRLSSSSSSSPCIYVPHLYSFTYKNPIVKCCHILRYWEMHFNKWIWGITIQLLTLSSAYTFVIYNLLLWEWVRIFPWVQLVENGKGDRSHPMITQHFIITCLFC